jgi:3-mercaptopyruvate sulfurtransferase SseA
VGFLTIVGTVALVVRGSQPVARYLPAPVPLDDKPAYEPQQISVAALRAMQGRADAPVLVDVRSPEAYRRGHLPGALSIPGYELPQHLEKVPLGVKLALYCS